ncbi:Detected protein of unknown function [Hibiscus syriacus]|uniref:HXXXD-type acyl-transferase family protein n=1 Tax=Hibiscus syriacus TaxID=106335 RepID=A0A6A3C5T6_HIBSY|nr:Detected protein of unknown function [Hibiscus syriacus]
MTPANSERHKEHDGAGGVVNGATIGDEFRIFKAIELKKRRCFDLKFTTLIQSKSQETMIFLVIGVRKRMQQVPEEYFGNAIEGAMVSLKARELMEKGFENAAWEINQIVANQSEKNLRNSFKSWVNKPLLFQAGKMMNNALLTANSPSFDIYGNDFGWGRPIAVTFGAELKIDGLLTVSTGVEVEGDIEIRVFLSPETSQAMENDEDFIAALNI